MIPLYLVVKKQLKFNNDNYVISQQSTVLNVNFEHYIKLMILLLILIFLLATFDLFPSRYLLVQSP